MSDIEIIPTNTCPPTLAELGARTERFAAFAPHLQLDIGDGVFVSTTSWPYGEAQWEAIERMATKADILPLADSVRYEAHLMVEDPLRIGELLARIGCTRIIGHLETFPDPDSIRDAFSVWRGAGASDVGLALLIDTPLEDIAPIADECGVIQLMSIATLGKQGAPFDSRAIARVEALRARHPSVVIEVDGGVSFATLPDLVRAGATRFGVGSSITAAEDPARAYDELKHLAASVL